MITVYMMTFPNTKRYIGVATNFENRMSQHKSAALTGRKSFAVHKALKKYKKVNIKKLAYFNNLEDALKYEQQMIRNYDSINFGYNLTEGGQGFIPSDKIKNKISNSLCNIKVRVFKKDFYIGEWENLNKCAQDLNLYRPNITHCIKGRLKTTGGYRFEAIKNISERCRNNG